MDDNPLRVAAKLLLKSVQQNQNALPLLLDGLPRHRPTEKQLAELVGSFENKQEFGCDIQSLHENILLLELYFRDSDIARTLPPDDALLRFRSNIVRTLLPTDAFAEQSPFSQEHHSKSNARERPELRAVYAAGLRLLSHILRIEDDSSQGLSTDLILCLASFTHAEDAWTNEASCFEASRLLGDHIKSRAAKPGEVQSLLTTLLRNNVKPAFAKSKNSAITPAGRKAISSLPPRIEASIDEAVNKPWKHGQVFIVTVFEWVLGHLDAPSIDSNWPLLIPPLLALLDDASTAYKIRGCSLLAIFLKTVQPALLERTGLGEVFQEALVPCLLYLPELTPEPESLHLLGTVYPTLLSLTRTRFTEAKDKVSKQKTLDHIFRHGILKGYAQAGGNVRIAEYLTQTMTKMVNEMEMASSKHLKQILPLLSDILTDPFATAYPPLLLAALQATQSVTTNNWPRMPCNRSVILKSLALCWCNIMDEDDPERYSSLKQVQTEIKHCARLLTAVLKRNVDVASEYGLLVASDDRLEELLTI